MKPLKYKEVYSLIVKKIKIKYGIQINTEAEIFSLTPPIDGLYIQLQSEKIIVFNSNYYKYLEEIFQNLKKFVE